MNALSLFQAMGVAVLAMGGFCLLFFVLAMVKAIFEFLSDRLGADVMQVFGAILFIFSVLTLLIWGMSNAQ